MFFCGSARRLPSVIVTAAKTANTAVQLTEARALSIGNATRKRRARTAKPAALDAVERKPAIGVGAPSYTSGAQKWSGTRLTLNPRPTMSRSTTPRLDSGGTPPVDMAAAMAYKSVVPEKPYSRLKPYNMMADVMAP